MQSIEGADLGLRHGTINVGWLCERGVWALVGAAPPIFFFPTKKNGRVLVFFFCLGRSHSFLGRLDDVRGFVRLVSEGFAGTVCGQDQWWQVRPLYQPRLPLLFFIGRVTVVREGGAVGRGPSL